MSIPNTILAELYSNINVVDNEADIRLIQNSYRQHAMGYIVASGLFTGGVYACNRQASGYLTVYRNVSAMNLKMNYFVFFGVSFFGLKRLCMMNSGYCLENIYRNLSENDVNKEIVIKAQEKALRSILNNMKEFSKN